METDAYPLPGEFPHHQATKSCSLLLSAFDDTNLTFLPTQHPGSNMRRASPPLLACGGAIRVLSGAGATAAPRRLVPAATLGAVPHLPVTRPW